VGVGDRSRCRHQASGAAGGERRGEPGHVAALGADAGQQERCTWHQLAQPGEMLGFRGARDRADVGQARAAGLPEPGDHARKPLAQSFAGGQLAIEDVGGSRVGRSPKLVDAGLVRARGLDERQQCVAAEQRVGREGVRAEAGDGAERGWGARDQRLPVGGGGHRHVAALAVGEDHQPALAGVLADVLERQPARGAEALEAGQLRLDGHARVTRGVDQGARVREDRGGRLQARDDACGARAGRRLAETAGGVHGLRERRGKMRPRLARGLQCGGPQLRGIGIDPEDDLRLTRRDRVCQPVTEVRERGQTPVSVVRGHRARASPGRAPAVYHRRPSRRVT
jgi:hypothetical protein